MYVTYRPDEGDQQEWEFDPDKIGDVEAEMIEKRTGSTFDEFLQNLQTGSIVARRALLWTFLRRQHHTLRYEDVHFTRGQVSVEYTREEMLAIRAQVEKAPDNPAVDKAMILARMDAEIETARSGPGKALGKSAA